MEDYIRYANKVAFLKPIDGDILNKFDGVVRNGKFFVDFFIKADKKEKVFINGEKAEFTDGLFKATLPVIDGENVAYTLTYSIYVDGVKVYEVLTDPARYVEKNYLLYNATIDENDHSKLNYTDNTADQEVNKRGFRWLVGVDFFRSASDKWLVLSDYYISSGHDFVQRVEPVATPAAATITLGGNDYPAEMYYKLAD